MLFEFHSFAYPHQVCANLKCIYTCMYTYAYGMWCQRRCFVELSRRYRRPTAAVSQASKGGIATQIFGAARLIVSVAPSLSLFSFRVTILPTVSAMHSLGVWEACAGLNQHRSHCHVECVTPRLHSYMSTHVRSCGFHGFLCAL